MDEIKLSRGLPGARGMTEQVRRACMRYVQNRDEADDVAQEVLLKVFRSGTAFPEKAWLLRVATNQCLDHLRREKRLRLRAAAWARECPGHGEPERAGFDLPAFACSRADGVDGAPEEESLLERVRARLNEADRKLLHLRYDLGLPQAAIAEILGVSRPRVGQRLAAIHIVGVRVWRKENAAPEGAASKASKTSGRAANGPAAIRG